MMKLLIPDNSRSFHVVICLSVILLTMIIPAFAREPQHQESSRIIVGGDNNYPPYEFVDSGGRAAGFNVDLIRAVAEAMGLEVEIKLGPWAGMRSAVETGRVDMLQGMFYSEKRTQLLDFSMPHTVVYHAVFIRKGSTGIRSLEDVKDKEILVQKGDIMHDYVLENRLSKKVIAVDAPEDALRLLASGKHDCALLAKMQGLYLANRFRLSNLTTAGKPFSPREYCFAVKKGNEGLLLRLNEGLGIIKETGRYREISDKWLGVLEPPGISKDTLIKYTFFVLALFLFLLSCAIFWFWSLKQQVALRTKELKKEISARQRTAEALRDREEKYRSIFENAVEGIFQTTPEGRYLSVNPALARMYGYDSPEDVMALVTDIQAQQYVVPEDRLRLKEVYGEHGFVEGFETQMYRKDGSIIWISMSSRAVRDHDGVVLYYEGTALDISGRKRAEEQIKTSLGEKEVLLKEVHHRVKNNLQIMSSLLNLQTQYLNDPATREMFRTSMDRIKSMALIHDKLYRSESLSSIYFPGYVSDLVRDLVGAYSVGKGIALDLNVDPVSLDMDTAIPLGLVINELVSNALKHGFPGENGGAVSIGLHKEDTHVTLTISDDGIGFPRELDFMDTPSLGMQLVVALVEQLEGTMELRRDEGTEFRITFKTAG
jgi:PAS domain S-box-containing protein